MSDEKNDLDKNLENNITGESLNKQENQENIINTQNVENSTIDENLNNQQNNENIINTQNIINSTTNENINQENIQVQQNQPSINIQNTITETDMRVREELYIKEEKRKKLEELKRLQIEELRAKREKRKSMFKELAKNSFKGAVCLGCFLMLGAGISIGGNFSKEYMENKVRTDFSFENINKNNIPVNVEGDFITKTSASSIFEDVGDSVVNISTKVSSGFFKQNIQDASSGSGIIYKVDEDKVYIITNNHVIEQAEYVTISVTGEEQINAKLVGTDPRSDLAVLEVSKADMEKSGIEKVNVAKFADSDTVKVGDFVFPIGNALGRGKTMTNGMISAQNKEINIDGKNLTVLQTDAPINPGNSGGALMNTKGEVVGINTAKLSSSAIEGIGYAIPTNIAVEIVDQIIEHGYVQRPYFGIIGKTLTESMKEIYGINVDGVFVINVEEDSNADKAGLKQGDIITSFNGDTIKTLEDLSNAIKKCKPNDTVAFKIVRNGVEERKLSVKLVPSSVEF